MSKPTGSSTANSDGLGANPHVVARVKAEAPVMAYLSPLRTRTAWDVTDGYASRSEFGSTQYWAGAELLSSTYFFAECTEELNSGRLRTTTFITYDVKHATDYLMDGPAPISSRILVLKRGPSPRETRLDEVSKVLRCTVTGALVIRLANGELLSDGNEPAPDAKGLHHFEIIYPRLVHPKSGVRMGPNFDWSSNRASSGT